jgi:putative endonuclease
MWHYVYIIKNKENRQYVGSTINIEKRLQKYNNSEVQSTSKYKPWELKFACSFLTKKQAILFEKYLKSGLGTTFRYRRLVPNR